MTSSRAPVPMRPVVPPRSASSASRTGSAARSTIAGWRAVGFDAGLVGEALVRSADPAAAVRAFVAAGRQPQDIVNRANRATVKICGVTDAAGALAAVRAGAEAVGLNFVPGTPRALAIGDG